MSVQELYGKDALVWVKDPVAVWRKGTVVSADSNSLRVGIDGTTEVRVLL